MGRHPAQNPGMDGNEAPGVRSLNLALQGGGSHGAFTWGVLDALLADGLVNPEVGAPGACAGPRWCRGCRGTAPGAGTADGPRILATCQQVSLLTRPARPPHTPPGPQGKFVTFYGKNFTKEEMARNISDHVTRWQQVHPDWKTQ